MKLIWMDRGWEDYVAWQAEDPAVLRKINELIKATQRDPFRGLGKPEPLQANLKGWWSRRITEEHRLVYRVGGAGAEQFLEIAQGRLHY